MSGSSAGSNAGTRVERTEVEGFDAVRLGDRASHLATTFVPGAGMVGVSLRHGDAELLGQRGGLLAYVRERKTMGIPLLHPWANRLAGNEYSVAGETVRIPPDASLVRHDAHGLPMHGLLLGSPLWRSPAPESGQPDLATDLSASLDFGAHRELLELFPFPHRLRLDVALRAATLTVRTTLTATGDRPVPVAFGFHPYLRLPGVERRLWRVELPPMRRLELDDRGIPTGADHAAAASAAVLGSTARDDGYVDVAEGASFTVAGAGTRLTVRLEHGYPAAQVYAPLDDDVICFEPMTAPTNALRSGDRLALVAPGERYSAAFSITVADD